MLVPTVGPVELHRQQAKEAFGDNYDEQRQCIPDKVPLASLNAISHAMMS